MAESEPSLPDDDIKKLCETLLKYNYVDPDDYERFNVKKGLRNADGTGVMAGVTGVCTVDGYYVEDGEKVPREGKLFFRGINMEDLVEACEKENRFGFEEAAYLLLFGSLPTRSRLDYFCDVLSRYRELTEHFIEDMIIKAPSPDVMNKMARSILALYSYDDAPDDISIENVLGQCMRLIARLPAIMVYAYQVKRRNYYHKSMYIHQMKPEYKTAQTVLHSLRTDKNFTDLEAKLLDVCLIVHAEHGGGNNSTFAVRTLTSSGTDTYSAMAAGIGSLKGPKHGGANIKVAEMIDFIKAGVKDITDEGQVADFLIKILKKEAGDRSGLIYGVGHAVYTLSDPRAKILKAKAEEFVKNTEFEDDLKLLSLIERLAPRLINHNKSVDKCVCANVDLYSGLVYKALGVPPDLFTPIFAVARIAGWSAHRLEELITCKRIIRPAYKSNAVKREYVPIDER